MTTPGDLIVGGTSGAAGRLGVGTNGFALVVVGGTPAWASVNPMTAAGDLIVGGASGVATRLPKATDGMVLKLVAGTPTWVAAPALTVVLPLDQARFPDGSAGNAFPLPVERISTGTPPANFPKLVELVYQFDAVTLESLIWKTIVPAAYAGGGITIGLKWSMVSATTGNIRALVGLTPVADGASGLTPIVTATAISADIAVPATAGLQKETRLTPAGGPAPVAGDKLLVTVSLLAGSASNAAGDRVLEAAWLEFA
jgi:hypothetical protein